MKLPKKPYNNYNIYFILERALLLNPTGANLLLQQSGSAVSEATTPTGFECLELPPLPLRYRHLGMILAVRITRSVSIAGRTEVSMFIQL